MILLFERGKLRKTGYSGNQEEGSDVVRNDRDGEEEEGSEREGK